ncbi:dTDP-4-dehydrorhamnose reductase [Synechocystis sp. LKSZ1]|uniref:dTDP-4-dehydrorhamnose reductase n=1 Tax=Synechocystis sp. LKSZ1 TaxID=3144951 RepID=UPI00336BBA01
MAKILLLGAAGQVGQALQSSLASLGEVQGLTRQDLDLIDLSALRQRINQIQPTVIVNAAAYTAVDQAEAEPALAHRLNAQLPGVLAEQALALGAYLVHLSTDYVFDGRKNTPYLERDVTHPLGVYGQSKLAGERQIEALGGDYLILRTAWVYGAAGKGNFVKTMLRLAQEQDTLKIVVDQVGSPTWTQDLAQALAILLPQRPQGIYHCTDSGVASWYDFAVAIVEEAQTLGILAQTPQIIPITTAEYPTLARRPAYSVLSGQKITAALNYSLPHWRQSLRAMLRSLI